MLITGIETHTFHQIVADLRSEGWETISEYDGFDVWIDYGKIVLRKDETDLTFEWDNWSEGEVAGPEKLLQALKEKYVLR